MPCTAIARAGLALVSALSLAACASTGSTGGPVRAAGSSLPLVSAAPLVSSQPAPSARPSPSGLPSQPAPSASVPATKVTKVLVIVEENHSLAQMKAGMPYLYGLARRFSYASDWTAATHPSLPNYLAMAAGSTFGIRDDAAPSAHPLPGPSVFASALAAGRTARSYQEAMPSACSLSPSGRYAVKHNPWAYFPAERAACRANDLPAGTPSAGRLHSDIGAGRLPDIGLLIPDLCHDAHDCPLGTADSWLRGWLPQVMTGPDWQAGRLAVVVTADEDDRSSGNRVLTVVLHPSLDGTHRVVTTPLSSLSLTRLQTAVAHSRCVRAGCTAPDMARAFRLPV